MRTISQQASEQDIGREKVNFMINRRILVELKQFIPAGERSDFVNGSLEDALTQFKRAKAIEMMDEFSKENKWHMSDAEIRKARAYGRE